MEKVAEQTTKPQQEAMALVSMSPETHDQQLDVSVELQDDKLTNEEPPPAST